MSHHYSGPNATFPRGDARLDLTDLYAFPKPEEANRSVIIVNFHPSSSVAPPRPTPAEPFAPGARYELRIDTNGDDVADVTYQVRFSRFENGGQTATLRTFEGPEPIGTDSERVCITVYQSRRAARYFAISSKKSLCALKKKESLGAKSSICMPRSRQC